jgi:hypothetical protein
VLKVSVTQGDIDNGTRCSWFRCPIALAAKRLDNVFYVSVTAYDMTVRVGAPPERRYRTFLLPAEAKEFIRAFDAGRPVQPFTFDAEEFPHA